MEKTLNIYPQNKKELTKKLSSLIKDIGLVLFFSLMTNIAIAESGDKGEIKDIGKTNSLEKKNLYEQKLLKIVNFEKLSTNQKEQALQDIIYWEKRLDLLNVPEFMRVPLEAVCVEENKRSVNIVTKFRDINYFPSVSLAYQLSETNYKYFLQYGKDAPTLTIICGLMSKETGIRDITNPEGDSEAYGQLHKPTAEDLLLRKKSVYDKYFRIENGHLIFNGKNKLEREKNMIEFIYHFLIEEKGYKEGQELMSLARYNGSQHNLNSYAKPVIKKAISYAIFFAAVNNNTLNYDKEIKPIEYLLIEEEKSFGKQVTPKIVRAAFEYQVADTKIWRKDPKNYNKNKSLKIEDNDIRLMYGKYSYTTIDKESLGDPYIIPEKGKTIFSYFRENTREATEYHNKRIVDPKEKIEIFTYELVNNKKIKYIITSKQEMIQKYNKGYTICASPDKKKIYINSANKLYYYEGTEERVRTIYYDSLNPETTNKTTSEKIQYHTTTTGEKIQYHTTTTQK